MSPEGKCKDPGGLGGVASSSFVGLGWWLLLKGCFYGGFWMVSLWWLLDGDDFKDSFKGLQGFSGSSGPGQMKGYWFLMVLTFQF